MQSSWSGDAAPVVTATNTGVSNQLSRVTRPTNTNNRRRSRASRKTPTTLLNTDTSNFRAMVQQFTGGGNVGAAPLPSHDHSSSVTATHHSLNTYSTTSSNINDGVASSSPVGGLFPHDGRNVQYRQQHSRQPYFTMTVDDGGSSTGYDGDDQNLGYGQRGPYSYNW
ncbi:VQ-like protein [Cynara cardunculus var. scolymus]|uniref:VQ-like protein n=2 Tax=Cynara cardunculus var. scolymus TaxID=59895 RepID=A0A103XF86_CYNCS|nr:VQ-like protein [Cynara cardunculus var. scolymus]